MDFNVEQTLLKKAAAVLQLQDKMILNRRILETGDLFLGGPVNCKDASEGTVVPTY